MTQRRTVSIFLAVALATGLSAVSACKGTSSSTVDASPDAISPAAETDAGDAEPAKLLRRTKADLNRAVPQDGTDGLSRVAVAEDPVRGYVEWKFQREGRDVVAIIIVDVTHDAIARSRFEGVSEKVNDYPVVTFGEHQSSLLVAEKFQVKATSLSLDHEARKAWLAKCDLASLVSQK